MINQKSAAEAVNSEWLAMVVPIQHTMQVLIPGKLPLSFQAERWTVSESLKLQRL